VKCKVLIELEFEVQAVNADLATCAAFQFLAERGCREPAGGEIRFVHPIYGAQCVPFYRPKIKTVCPKVLE